MTLTDILFLIALIIALSTAVFLIYSWNTPNLKDMVDKEVEKQQQETFTGELTSHIKEAIDKIEVKLEKVKKTKTESLTEQPTKKKRYYSKKKK
jgi:hypothetical protein